MKNIKYIAFILLFFVCALLNAQQNGRPKKTRILFVLDASGSMLAEWEGKQRMDIAKGVLSNMIDTLSNDPNVSLALRVYGHQYHKRYGNCRDTKLEAPFAAKNERLIKQKLYDIEPQGVTPIAYSLSQAANDFPNSEDFRNVIDLNNEEIEDDNDQRPILAVTLVISWLKCSCIERRLSPAFVQYMSILTRI